MRKMYDANTVLVAYDTTKTADFNGDALAFDLVPQYPANVAHDFIPRVMIQVQALTLGGNDMTFNVEVSDTSDFTDKRIVGTARVTETGLLEIPIQLETVAKSLPNLAYIRLALDVTLVTSSTSSPSITYGSWIDKP